MRLIIVLAILGFGLTVLFLNHDSGQSFGMDNEDFGHLIRLLPFAAMLSVGLLASRRSLSESVRQLAVWLLIVLALATGYLYRFELQAIGDRLLAGLVPGRAVVVTTSEGVSEVMLHKSLGGHFETSVAINGVPVSVLIDTGASSVALRYEDAMRIGINPADLSFTQTIMTANGRAMAAPLRLRQLALGPIMRENVQAAVIERGRLDQSLLGMSFLSTLGSLQMQSDELRLRD
ncbi:aspartic protease [Ciceribacter naphthalenivorans]|uniref:Aspartic protease n=3 Tax=Alphaproteobacteria TaxID=28211 RepID=A0A512HCA8_9HYPH|nr:TIGR02281 family clan AA aspartic protease [Sphingomonas psychrolutea]GEO83084.1 aspartic protease [Ciceribacter naphthalenivorans]GLR20521.1 aspartic protease [Ciceribacter naphthalenivorans]GLT03377.1 aspartic protease [Sphingomonas psychrolutea]